MKIDKLNNLLELFYHQYQNQKKDDIFLESLKEPRKKHSWEDIYLNINKLSEKISEFINEGDRCLLI